MIKIINTPIRELIGSINTRTDNIKPLLTLGEFERLTQQNINENVPAQTCNNTLLYRGVMNERMKSVF
jgi:sulfur relay (sulfurtransferase) complex TusBCD TusD component (DsrE family)